MTPEEHIEGHILREEGSATTRVAALKLKRQFIGLEVDLKRYGLATTRINEFQEKLKQNNDQGSEIYSNDPAD